MKVTKLGSATVIVETDDVRIMCDPWLTDGIYYGSWCNYPPIEIDKCDFSDLDYIYISHVHPDHFDPKTMEHVNKDTPVLIHKYHQKFLKSNIERLGFETIELDNATPLKLSTNTRMSIFAADNCDPTICGHMFGCVDAELKGSMQIDSLCVIDDGQSILVNTNDCPYGISKNTLEEVKKNFPKIDIALIGYTSASLFPHCMMDYSEDKMKKGIQAARYSGLSSAFETLKILQPKYYMPFAGTYIIGGSEYLKNKNLPLPELQDAVEEIQNNLSVCGIRSKPVMLNFSEHFDVKHGKQSSEYIPIDAQLRKEYINEVARFFEYEFDQDELPDDNELFALFEQALLRLQRKQSELGFYEDINLLFDLPSGSLAKINLKDGSLSKINHCQDLNNWHRFKLNPKLLARALKGPWAANWNNIEIGGLLEFSRKPDNYRMDVHILINALHG